MRTANPAMRESIFMNEARTGVGYGEETMTVNGAVNKTAILLALAFLSASFTWSMAAQGNESAMMWGIGGAILGLILAIVTAFKPVWSMYTAPMYALCEGLFLGGITYFFEQAYPGIATQAIFLTFGVLLAMLGLYKSGIIVVTEKFRMGVFAATGAIFFVYMLSFIFSLIGWNFPMIHRTGPIGIVISLVIIVIAALNLVLDFDLIDKGARYNAPKYMEWYGGFALMVTLVWLYIEILRLLAIINSRD